MRASYCIDFLLALVFQLLKDDAVKVLHSICQQMWKTQQWPQDWKRSILIPIPKKSSTKECSNHRTIALISHASKVLHARLQHDVNQEYADVHAGFRKGRGTIDQTRKTSTSVSLTMLKPLTVWIITNYGKLLKRWEYQTSYLSPEKPVNGSRRNN